MPTRSRIKRCQVIIKNANTGRTVKCGIPLDDKGKCPDHGRSY